MPQYTLQTMNNGILTDTTYTLLITGSAASNVNVQYSATGSGPWTDFSGTAKFEAADGQGSPAAPQDGDTLKLTGTIGAYTLSGTRAYESGDGYTQASATPEADDADWAASGN